VALEPASEVFAAYDRHVKAIGAENSVGGAGFVVGAEVRGICSLSDGDEVVKESAMGINHKIINVFLRQAWTGQFAEKTCTHLGMARQIQPSAEVCEDCVAVGDRWPALRMCLTCGHVGCCDKAKNQHALKHFHQTGHPLIKPYKERGMNWIWCYVDQALLQPMR